MAIGPTGASIWGQLAIGANGPTNHTGIGPNKGTYRGQLAIGANGSYDPKGHKGPTGHKGQTTSIRHIDFAKEAMLTTLATSRGAPRHMRGVMLKAMPPLAIKLVKEPMLTTVQCIFGYHSGQIRMLFKSVQSWRSAPSLGSKGRKRSWLQKPHNNQQPTIHKRLDK